MKLPLIPKSRGSQNGAPRDSKLSLGKKEAPKKKPINKDELPTTATPTKIEDENNSIDQPTSVDSKGRKKFTFADLFRDEGMYHSVNEAPVVKLLR